MTTEEEIKKLIEMIDDINSRLKAVEIKISQIGEQEIEEPKVYKTKKSISDLIIELKDESFFDQPKYTKEIVDALANKGYHYEPASLTWTLQNLIRKSILGRITKDKKWAYVKR